MGLAPILTSSPSAATSIPVSKITLVPFIHVRNSTVTTIEEGIGYVDSVVNITNGVLAGSYTNFTEIQDTTYTNHTLKHISVYGNSQIVINNTNWQLITLFVYDSSQVTLINSTIAYVITTGSAKLTLRNNSKAVIIQTFGNSEVSIFNSKVYYLSVYENSTGYASDSLISYVYLTQNSYLNASNSGINLFIAYDFSNGFITNNSTIMILRCIDAADISVENSTIHEGVTYGLVCNEGSLTLNGTNADGLENCRNTTTLIESTYPTPYLVSISAIGNSIVNILNNNTIVEVYARDNSSVNLENDTGIMNIICTDYSNTIFKNSQNFNEFIALFCGKYSSITLQNITSNVSSYRLYEQSSAMIKNCSTMEDIILDLFDQSTATVENLILNNSSNCTVRSWDLSVVDIVNVTTTGSAESYFYSYDLSVMTINASITTNVGYAVKSNGTMLITEGMLEGSYINTTKWYDSTPENVILNSIAVIGDDTATITDSSISASVFIRNTGQLNVYNSTFINESSFNPGYVIMQNSSTINSVNTTFQVIHMFDSSIANLSNITVSYVLVYSSATMICNGSNTATSNLDSVKAIAHCPDYANITINNCTITTITSITDPMVNITSPRVEPPPSVSYYLPLSLYTLYSSSPNQTYINILSLVGVLIFTTLALAVLFKWKRRA